MRRGGAAARRYALRSQQVLPFFVPRGRRTARFRSTRDVESEGQTPGGEGEAEVAVSDSELGCSTVTTAEGSNDINGFVNQSQAETSASEDSEELGESEGSDEMDPPAVVPSTREGKFSGRPGTQTLRDFKGIKDFKDFKDFKAQINALISRYKFKHGNNYTAQFMFEQLPTFIADEALDLYDAHQPLLAATRMAPNPAHPQALQLAYDNRLAAAKAAHQAGVANQTIDPAVTPEPT